MNIKINLPDTDIKKFFEKAAGVGLSPDELLGAFIGDLVDGTYTNGSDERMYIEQWFDRCMFSANWCSSFLSYLIRSCELDYYFDLLKNVSECKDEISETDISEFDSRAEYEEEIEYLNKRMESANEEVQEMFEEYCISNPNHKSYSEETEQITAYRKQLKFALMKSENFTD